jgi:hypothetical protein
MPLYVTVTDVAESPDYGLRTRESLEPLEPRAGEALVVFPSLEAHPSSTAFRWNRVTREYEAIPAPATTRTTGTKLDFRRKIGFDRESQLHQLARKTALPDALYGNIQTMIQWLNSADDVKLTDPDTITQTHQLAAIYSNATLMGLIGVTPLTEPEAAAYIAAVLTPWPIE